MPCGPGATVALTYVIPAIDMENGASDDTGSGFCYGDVVFSPVLEVVLSFQMYDEVTHEPYQVPYNGSGAQDCDPYHCQTLRYGDGREEPEYCTLVGLCENGLARSTGYTW